MKAVMPTYALAARFGIEKAVDLICDAGFEGIDFSDYHENSFVNEDDYKTIAKKIKERANRRGVEFCQAHAPFISVLLKQGDWDYVYKRLEKSIETAGILGVETIVIHPLGGGNYVINSESIFEKNVNFYKSLIPYCEKYGVKVALENMFMGRSDGARDAACAIPQEFKRYIDTINSPYITGCLDIGHAAICKREPQDVLRFLGSDRVTCLHIHDNDYITDRHTLPCTMNLNWEGND